MGVRILWIMPDTMAHLMTDGREFAVIKDGLPAGCRVKACGYDPHLDRLWFHFEHESWPETKKGDMIESLPPPNFKALT